MLAHHRTAIVARQNAGKLAKKSNLVAEVERLKTKQKTNLTAEIMAFEIYSKCLQLREIDCL